MSNWMISHVFAYILSPILAALLLGLGTSIYYGSFVEFGFGVAMVSFVLYIFLVFGVAFILILFSIRKKETFQSNLSILIVLSIIGGFLFQSENTIGVMFYYGVTSIIYVYTQLLISKLLISRFNIHNEFLNENVL